MLRPLVFVTFSLGSALVLTACDKGAGPAGAARPAPAVVARVNGKPITAPELAARLRPPGPPRPEKPSPEAQLAALEQLITQELEAQRAAELGLDADPNFLTELEQMEGLRLDWRRKELAKLYRSKELLNRTAVTVEEAQAFFNANAAKVQTEVTLQQIPFRKRDVAEAAVAALAQGKTFEEVAAPQYPGATAGETPWVMATIRWEEVPKSWWPEIDRLTPGQVSTLIEAPNDQYWILKLVEKHQNTGTTFEMAKSGILNLLRAQKFEELRTRGAQDLRGKAKIELLLAP